MAKILLADDSAFMRKVLSDILVKNGYQDLIEAENGQQAVEKYNAEKPELVLLDIIMPEKDGIGVLQEIVPQGAKALVISAVGQDDMIEQAKTAGAQGYIIKPFEEAQVVEEVKKILSGQAGGSTVNSAPQTNQEQPAQAPAPAAPVSQSTAQTTPPANQTAPQPATAEEVKQEAPQSGENPQSFDSAPTTPAPAASAPADAGQPPAQPAAQPESPSGQTDNNPAPQNSAQS